MVYTRDKNLRLLIINCIATRKTEQESLTYLKNSGYDIKARQFNRIKSRIKADRHKRIGEIANTGFIDAHLEAIDTFIKIKAEMWKQYDSEQHPYKKVEILTQIANLQPYINEYYSATKDIMESKGKEQYDTDNTTIDT